MINPMVATRAIMVMVTMVVVEEMKAETEESNNNYPIFQFTS
jgi:hypothetical protein